MHIFDEVFQFIVSQNTSIKISAGCSELTQEFMEPHPFYNRNALHGLFEAGADTEPLPELLDDRNSEDLCHVSQICLSPK